MSPYSASVVVRFGGPGSVRAELARWGAVLSLSVAAIGVGALQRVFAKTKVMGPIFILEALFIAFLAFAFLSRRPVRLERMRGLLPVAAFSAWGATLALGDVVFWGTGYSAFPWMRFAQHCLLWMYPLMWSVAGFWFYDNAAGAFRAFAYVFLAVNLIPSLTMDKVANISHGPLGVILCAWALHAALAPGLAGRERAQRGALALALSYVAFGQYWWMWLGSMQRTTLVLGLASLVGVPFLLAVSSHDVQSPARGVGARWARAVGVIVAGVALLCAGFLGATAYKALSEWSEQQAILQQMDDAKAAVLRAEYEAQRRAELARLSGEAAANVSGAVPSPGGGTTVQPSTLGDSVASPSGPLSAPASPPIAPATEPESLGGRMKSQLAIQFFSSLQKGEDLPEAHADASPFQGRFRRFCWKTALEDWRERPLIGRGFIPEIPSYISPGRPNDGGYEFQGAPPVVGPHNSYLSVLARMGVPGAALMAWILFAALVAGWRCFRSAAPSVPTWLLLFVPFNGFLHALFNIGLESPHNSMALWLFLGALLAAVPDRRAVVLPADPT